MTRDRTRHNRRLWAWLTLFGSVACLGSSALIWISHYMEFVATGHVHHKSLALVLGVDWQMLGLALCLMLPLLGLALLYAFVAIWTVGVYRNQPDEEAALGELDGALPATVNSSAGGD